MTTTTATLEISWATLASGKAYVARITGLDAHYGLGRDFLRRVERDSARSGRTGTDTYVLVEPGLYEYTRRTHKGYHKGYLELTADGSTVDLDRDAVLARLGEGA